MAPIKSCYVSSTPAPCVGLHVRRRTNLPKRYTPWIALPAWLSPCVGFFL